MGAARRIAIVGGGITGLAAAWELRAAAVDGRAEVTLFEASDRLGGTVATDRSSGHVLEMGPDSFVTRKPETMALVREAGLEGSLIGVKNRRTYIYHAGRFHPMPPVSPLGIPASLRSMAGSSLFSPWGKMRAAWDLLAPRSGVVPGGPDQAVGPFLRRRLGKEVVERLVAPMAGGVHLTDIDLLSLQSVYPQLVRLENEYRSLMVATVRESRKRTAATGTSPFMTLREGLSSLVNTLGTRLPPVTLRTKTGVTALSGTGAATRITTSAGDTAEFDRVILAVPPHASARMVQGARPSLAGLLTQVRYSPVIAVGLVYPEDVVPPSLDGNGFMVPQSEGVRISGATFLSRKWGYPGEGPGVSMRVYLSRGLSSDGPGPSTSEVLDVVRRDLRTTLGVEQPPTFAKVFPHSRAMPQYRVGHLDWMRSVAEAAASVPGLQLAGAAFGGVGLSDCIRSGRDAARASLA